MPAATIKQTTKKQPRAAIERPLPANREGKPNRHEAHPTVGRARSAERRRLIDPTTCERDYCAEELEFMQALERYKRTSGRMFPTCSEVLEVVRSLGYAKQG
jgi:hypothetical protein